MKFRLFAPLGIVALVAACGQTDMQRAGTGAAGGAIAGLALGGPVGMLVGGAAGAGAGAYRDEVLPEADQLVARGTQEIREEVGDERRQANNGIATRQSLAANRNTASSRMAANQMTNAEVRNAQQALQQMGLYEGEIDGLFGPKTASAVGVFQQQKDLPVTMTLNNQTAQALRTQMGSSGASTNNNAAMSGSSRGQAGVNHQGQSQTRQTTQGSQDAPVAYPQQSRQGNDVTGTAQGAGGAGSTSDRQTSGTTAGSQPATSSQGTTAQ